MTLKSLNGDLKCEVTTQVKHQKFESVLYTQANTSSILLSDLLPYIKMYEDTIVDGTENTDLIALWWATLFKSAVQCCLNVDDIGDNIHVLDNIPRELEDKNIHIMNAIIYAMKAKFSVRQVLNSIFFQLFF